jgi:hypothetical protein
MLLRKDFYDAVEYKGRMTLILTLTGNSIEIDDVGLCMVLCEPYANRWGFNVRDLINRGRPVYKPGDTVFRIMVYEKKFPSIYDSKHITFFNQKYTPEIHRQVEHIRELNTNITDTIEL